MFKNYYPESVSFLGENIFSKISLKPEFKLERKAMRTLSEGHFFKKYLSFNQQNECIAHLSEDKLFVDNQKQPFHGTFHFVLTCEKNPRLLVHPEHHHSYLANGKKVLACGSLTFKKGKLKQISNNSGHYRPTDEEMFSLIKALYHATNGSLKYYKSYSHSPATVYSVSSFLKSTNSPIVRKKAIDDSEPNFEPLYTETTEEKLETEERRYGRILKDNTMMFFNELIRNSQPSTIIKIEVVCGYITCLSDFDIDEDNFDLDLDSSQEDLGL